MILKTKKYTSLDALRIPLKASPAATILQLLIGAIQAAVPTIFMALTTAYFVDTAISIHAGELERAAIALPLILLIIVVGVNSTISSFPGFAVSRLRFNLERKLVPALLDIRASLNYKHIENAQSWELIGRVTGKPVQAFLDSIRAYATILRCMVAILSVLGLVVAYNWWAAPVILGFAVPLMWVALRAGKKNYEAHIDTRKYERRHEYYNDVLTNRQAVEERSLFGYSSNVSGRFMEQYETARKMRFWVTAKQYVMMKCVSLSMAAVAFLVAATLILPLTAGELSPGMFMGIVSAVFGMIGTLGWLLQDAAEEVSKSREYMKDFTAFVELSRTQGAKDLPDAHPPAFETLEFRNVRFKYPTQTSETYVLDGISFKLENGKHYAFVGANGAGKTTATKLLTGLYDEYEGEILVNGKELRQYPQSTIKSMFSVVYQDFARYQVSMLDNIALGDTAQGEEISNNLEKICETANAAGLADTITALKDGINTPLGKILEDGVDISGGQWQKVAIARSLLSRAPVKILDEPTAALDPIAESEVYRDFEALMKGKTTVFISHRLGSTKLADEILVIGKGKVAERGTHDELMAQGGLYAQMYEAQKEWYE
ncbi:MAG: ABC transporter ATP-binding protein/permease [Defluviitaleaceae bacterium]|nr:ABC transporter ATP-binding protein/permease [Defluviitaleaceae bacterium]